MYAAAGSYLGQADHLPIVRGVGDAESWIALDAWALTFAAMLRHVARTLSGVDSTTHLSVPCDV